MVTTRSKRKAEPEFIDLSSTEEDDVQNDVDNTVDSQKSKDDTPKTKSKETSEKANVSKAANKAVAFIGNAQSIDVYIPKSNFNIHIIDDDQILPAKNVLLKHPLKQQNTEISLSFQENYLVVNEVQGGPFVSASPNKERLMLSSNNIHPASEGSDEFFSAVEDKFEEDDNEQLADSIDPIKKDDADEEFIGADKHEEDDGFMNDNDQNTDDEPSSEATDEQMSDSDNSLAESQTEPMDNQGDYISSQGVIGVPYDQEAELAAKQQKEQEEKDRKRKEELEILQEKLAKQREEMKAKKLKIENERMAKKLEKQAKAEKLAEEARAKKEAKAEAKRLAEEAEAKKLAEEAKAKKLAEEAEAKRLAEEAEAKKLAEEAEAKKLAEEAKAKKLAEEAKAKKLSEEAKKLKEEELKKAAEEKEASDKPVEDDNESLLGFDDDSDHEHFTQGNHSTSNHSVPNIDDEIPEEPESVPFLDFNDDQDNYNDNQQSNSDSLQFSGQESASVAEDPKSKSSGEPEKDEASLGLSDSVKSNESDSASGKQESKSASPKPAPVEEDDDDDFEILDDPKKKISNAMKNDMFAYVSSSDEEEEAEEEEQPKPAPVSTSLPKKRTADEFSDDDFDEFAEIGSKKNKTDKTANELDLFFDDDIFDIPKSKPAEKKTTTAQDAKKALAALMPDLGNIKVTKRRSTLLPSVTKTASTVTSEKSGTPSKENNSGMAQSDSNVSTTNTQKAASPVDSDEKVKVTFVSQLTGFAKCIVIVSLKKKKTLRSISDKIIKTIMKQRPGSAYTYTSDDCSFYHKGVKLNKFNTIADIKMGPNENAVEITLVSADVEKELFKTGYEKMKSRELEESRMKQIDARMNLVDRSFSQIDKEIKDMDSVAAVKYTEEIGEVEAPAEAEDEPVDDGKFSIKLLDSHNKPKIVRVSSEMQISDVLKIFKESFSVNDSAKVTIMFDGDVVDLNETLEDLGMEEDDMLEFLVK